MSERLEQKVEELLELQDLKREIGRKKYRVRKEYNSVKSEVTSLVKSGHVLPQNSEFYVSLEDEEKGRLSYKYVVEKMEEKYSQFARVIEDLKQESREVMIETLDYGRKE